MCPFIEEGICHVLVFLFSHRLCDGIDHLFFKLGTWDNIQDILIFEIQLLDSYFLSEGSDLFLFHFYLFRIHSGAIIKLLKQLDQESNIELLLDLIILEDEWDDFSDFVDITFIEFFYDIVFQ